MDTLFDFPARAWLIALCFAFFSNLLFAQNEQHTREKDDRKTEERDDGDHEMDFEEEENPEAKKAANLERYLHEFNMTHDPKLNTIPSERLIVARNFAKEKLQQMAETAIPGIAWTERGPNNVGGRTRAILVDASDGTGNTVWAGGVAGGLWKTTNFNNASPTWVKVNDFFDNMAISSIKQDPANSSIIYFGTGEGYFNLDAVRGLGIWKTTNGGTTWAQIAATNNASFHYVQDLLIDNSGNLYAATRSGVRRSTDGGTSWAQVLGSSVGAGANNSASDLELGADGDVYASLGIFSTGNIFKSDATTHGANVGALGNWTEITPATGTYERIELATAPSDANRVYAVCQGSGSNSADFFFRSTTAGASWTSLAVPGFCDNGTPETEFTRGQAWYDLIMAVDPNDAQKVYVGGVDALRSSDGGNNWTQVTSWTGANCTGQDFVHADHHAIVFVNGSSTSAIWGTDGGIFHTANATAALPTFNSKNTGYNVTQFYACAMHPSTGSNYFLAGAQDNGTQKFTAAGLGNTTEFTGGDGGFCHIDQNNSLIQISAYVRNNYWVSTNGGGSVTTRFFNNSGRFINPGDYDNINNRLYAAHDAGFYFRWDDPSTAGNTSAVVNAGFAGQVSTVTCDPANANRVWMGDDAGNVYRVENAHTGAPTVTTFTGPTAAYVSSIDIDPTNSNRLMVCRSNFGVNSIYELIIAGNTGTWTSFEGNLPDMPVRWGMFNPNNTDQALIATELGVWSTDNINAGATDWDPTNVGLANTRMDMLQYRAADNMVAAASHGRGLYTATLGSTLFPSCTSLTSPVSGATGVLPTATLTWAAASNSPTGYRLTVGTTAGGGQIMNNVDVGNVTTFDPPGDFPTSATIFVKITPYNANGDAIGCTEESFMTNTVLSNPSACQLGLPIADNSCTVANRFPINVTGVAGTQLGTNVTLTNVKLTIAHTWDADLDIRLISPDNTTVELSTDNGSSGDNYGNPADATCTSVTNFSMGAATSITIGVAPFVGSFIPEGNFATFNTGANPNGVWTLEVCDDEQFDDGTLEFVELVFESLLVPPSCTNLTSPANGATNVALTAPLTWAAATGGPTGYKLTVGTTPGGGEILNNFDVGNVTTFNPPGDFPFGIPVYVKITPYNADGDATACAEQSFTTIIALPNPSACQLGLVILDGSCTPANRFPINVTGAPGTLLGTNVVLSNVKFIAAHTWDADLDIRLISPDNTTIELSTGNGSSGDNYGDPTDPACANFTNFSMGAATSVTAGASPFIGSFIPEGDFADFNTGINPNGIWTLEVCDNTATDAGTLEFVELVFQAITPPPACTNLSSPLNGATNVAANTVLNWTAASGSPTGYRLTVGTTPGGTDILNNVDVGNVTSYDPPGYLPYGATIYVKITPYNATGDATGCSTENFATGECIPNLVIVNIPVPTGDHKSLGELVSNNSTITNGTVVNFISDTGVLLNQNFVVEQGGIFEVILQNCN